MRLVAPPPRTGARASKDRLEGVHLGWEDAEVGTIADDVVRLGNEGACAGGVIDRDMGAREREKELDRSGRGSGSQERSQGRRASELATRTGDIPAVDHQPDAGRARRDAREVSVDLWSRVDRVALRDQGSRGIPGTLFGRHESAVSEHAVQDREVARRPGRDDRVGQVLRLRPPHRRS